MRGLAQHQKPRALSRINANIALPPGAMVLDLGSGIGNMVLACRKQGLRAFGVEPDRIGLNSSSSVSATALGIASQRLEQPPFAAATGEQLPFADATFDLVVMDQVIEHVANQEQVLAESIRVLKPGGALYVACPNYLRFHESHYKVWFLPLFPKFLGAFYLRLRGRDPALLRQIIYTTNWRVRKLLAAAGIRRFVDLNCEEFLDKCRGQGANASSRKAKAVVAIAGIPGLSSLMLRAASFYVRLREGGSEMVAYKDA